MSFAYYENGQLKTLTDNALQRQTYYTYDAAGRVSQYTSYSSPAP